MSAKVLERIRVTSVGDRVKRARERLDWSKNELARQAEIGVSTVSRIESGIIASPGLEILVRLSSALGVPISDLTGESEPTPQLIVYSGVVWVPFVERSVHAGVDAWREASGRTPLSAEEARGHHRLFAGRVTGSCMVPDIMPGATVIWDPEMRHPTDGQMVVVSSNGELAVKVAYRDNTGYVLASNDGDVVRPNGVVLEGVVVKITNNPRKGPHTLQEFLRQAKERRPLWDPEP
jgi:transcriptional regulator with XRE-family HTH domain